MTDEKPPTCPTCEGIGRDRSNQPCKACGGRGTKQEPNKEDVK